MNKNFSIYLDFIRFVAAIIVLLHHFSDILFSSDMRIFNIGHEAVVIFFVLSGYVVTYSVEAKKNSAREYFIARFSRIYSVAIPAIILTIILDVAGTTYCFDCYQDIYVALDHSLIRFISSITFTGELWFISILSFGNIPYWSIHYEIFFYVFFGAMLYSQASYRTPILCLLLLIAGPKMAIMLPLWLFGTYLYEKSKKDIPTIIASSVWLLSTTTLIVLVTFDAKNGISNATNDWFKQYITLNVNMAGSSFFMFDYLFAIFFGLHLLTTKKLFDRFNTEFYQTKIAAIIRYLANRTFSIYLYHFPLLGFLNAVLPSTIPNTVRWASILVLTLTSIFILSKYTEQKKHVYSRFLRRLSDKIPTYR